MARPTHALALALGIAAVCALASSDSAQEWVVRLQPPASGWPYGSATHRGVSYRGYPDRTVRLFDASTGAPLNATLRGHSGWIMDVLADDEGVLTASYDGTVRAWERGPDGTLALRGVLRGHEGGVLAVAADPDRAFTGSFDGTVRAWDRRTLEPLGVLGRFGNRVSALHLDDRYVYAGSFDETLSVWDRLTLEPVAHFQGPGNCVIALDSDEDMLYGLNYDRGIIAWERSSRFRTNVTVERGMPRVADLEVRGGELLVRAFGLEVQRWNATGGLGPLPTLHDGAALRRVHASHGLVLSAFDDGCVQVWRSEEGQFQFVAELWGNVTPIISKVGGGDILRYFDVPVTAVASDDLNVYGAWADGSINVWGLPLIYEMRDRYLEVYRSKTRRDASLYPRSVARGHTDVVTSLEPSGGRLFSASWDGTVRVWEAGPERLSRVATIEVGSGVLAVHAAGGMVYAGCADGEVRAYRDAPGFPLAARTRLPDAVAGLSSDHDHLYAAVLDRTVAVLSRDGLEPVRALHVSGGVPEAVAAIGGEVGAGVSVFDYYTVPLPPPPSARPWERLAAAAPALALALAAIALVLRRRRRGG